MAVGSPACCSGARLLLPARGGCSTDPNSPEALLRRSRLCCGSAAWGCRCGAVESVVLLGTFEQHEFAFVLGEKHLRGVALLAVRRNPTSRLQRALNKQAPAFAAQTHACTREGGGTQRRETDTDTEEEARQADRQTAIPERDEPRTAVSAADSQLTQGQSRGLWGLLHSVCGTHCTKASTRSTRCLSNITTRCHSVRLRTSPLF